MLKKIVSKAVQVLVEADLKASLLSQHESVVYIHKNCSYSKKSFTNAYTWFQEHKRLFNSL